MKKSFGFSKIAESDQLFSWVMLVSLVIYINFSLFFILAKRPEVKEVNQEILKRRIAKLIVKADFGELEKRNVKIESKKLPKKGRKVLPQKRKKKNQVVKKVKKKKNLRRLEKKIRIKVLRKPVRLEKAKRRQEKGSETSDYWLS